MSEYLFHCGMCGESMDYFSLRGNPSDEKGAQCPKCDGAFRLVITEPARLVTVDGCEDKMMIPATKVLQIKFRGRWINPEILS